MFVNKFLFYESFVLIRFVKEWVYYGVFNDIYGEFMIIVNDDYLRFRNLLIDMFIYII